MSEPTFRIRPYREADEAAVIVLWNTVFPNPKSTEGMTMQQRNGR